MSKTIWDKFAPIYSLTMKSQKNIYNYMYSHIGEAVAGKNVLELATGSGMIAKNVAWTAKEFSDFIESNGWKITASEVVPGRIDLMYAECVRK